MGMYKGSKWKRLAIFSDVFNNEVDCPRLCDLLRAEFGGASYEWWSRTVPHGQGTRPANHGPMGSGDYIDRDESPTNEAWLMVERGNWPLAFIIARDCGVSL